MDYYRRSLRGLVSDNAIHSGVVGDTIVGINALSSVLCVEPQIPISLHGQTSTSKAGDSTPERFLVKTHAPLRACGLSGGYVVGVGGNIVDGIGHEAPAG